MYIPPETPPLPPAGLVSPPGTVFAHGGPENNVVGMEEFILVADTARGPGASSLPLAAGPAFDHGAKTASHVEILEVGAASGEGSLADVLLAELGQQESRLLGRLKAMEDSLLEAMKQSAPDFARRVSAAAGRYRATTARLTSQGRPSDISSMGWKPSLDATPKNKKSLAASLASEAVTEESLEAKEAPNTHLRKQWRRADTRESRESRVGVNQEVRTSAFAKLVRDLKPQLGKLKQIQETDAEANSVVGRCIGRLHASAINITKDRKFDLLVAGMILANAVVIGINVDWAIHNVGSDPPAMHKAINGIFTAFFMMELTVRLLAELQYFVSPYNPNFWWNLFDSTMVIMAVVEEITSLLSGAGKRNISALRLLRILRLTRVVRFVRVMRFFRDLRVMVNGILGSMKALLWCILLLVLVMYMFACLVLQVVTVELEGLGETMTDARAESVDVMHAERSKELLELYFGSMGTCLYTLYKCIMGGVDWGEPAERLRLIHPAWVGPFLGYICFGMLCVLNVVTGVFVENANKITSQDHDHMISEEMSARQAYLNELRSLFEHADTDESGEVDLEEFRALTSQQHVQYIFRKIGLEVETISMTKLFGLFDPDGLGKIDIDEFMVGVQRLKGHARALDIVKLLHNSQDLKRRLRGLEEICIANFQQQIELEQKLCKSLGLEVPTLATDFPMGNSCSIGGGGAVLRVPSKNSTAYAREMAV